jgi:hypothetical protein
MPNEIVIPTIHAIHRVRERVGPIIRVKAFLDHLWAIGHPLPRYELAYRRKRDGADHDYRKINWKGRTYIVVRAGNKYVTLIRKGD